MEDTRKPLIVAGRHYEAREAAAEMGFGDRWEFIYDRMGLLGWERPLVYRAGAWMYRSDYWEIEDILRRLPGATLIDYATGERIIG